MSLFDLNWNGFDQLRRQMNNLFSAVLETPPHLLNSPWRTERGFLALNVSEDEDNLYAECELPGLKLEDLEISVLGNQLSLKGERKDPERPNATWHRREREVGAFSRSLSLPVTIDAEKVRAELLNGVLSITLPKAQAARPRKIEVKRLKA